MAGLNDAIAQQARVIWAVASRDAQVKGRSSPLGVASALLEPLAMITILGLIMSQIRMRVPEMGDSLILFLMTGVVPITLFRAGVANGERVVAMMRNALVLPRLRPIDLMLGAMLVHVGTLFALLFVLTGFFVLVMDAPMPGNIVMVLVPCLANALMAMGFAAINLTIRSWFPFYSILFSIIVGPIGILSGLFYTAATMPVSVQKILYYNPLMHSTELCRQAFFPEFESDLFDPVYYYGWVFGVLLVGLVCERLFRNRMVQFKG